MKWGDWLTLAVLVAIVAAVVFGRRSGKRRQALTIAAAEARGEANARASLAAQLTNSVTVVQGDRLPTESAHPDEVLVAALRRIAVGAARPDHDDVDSAADYLRSLRVGGTAGELRAAHVDHEWTAGDWNRAVAGDGVDREALSELGRRDDDPVIITEHLHRLLDDLDATGDRRQVRGF